MASWSIWTFVSDVTQAVNQWGVLLISLFQQGVTALINAVTLMLYPVYVFIDVILMDINAVYVPFAGFINMMILIYNIPVGLLNTVIVMPPIFTLLILAEIGMCSSIRIFNIVMRMLRLIPIVNMGA